MGRKLQEQHFAHSTLLTEIATALKQRRKQLGLTMEEVAEAAGISRVTLHRIERGETSVSIGAVAGVAQALGIPLSTTGSLGSSFPTQIKVSDYPGLTSLAWQLRPDTQLSIQEAWQLYAKNWRHLDLESLTEQERMFINALNREFGGLSV